MKRIYFLAVLILLTAASYAQDTIKVVTAPPPPPPQPQTESHLQLNLYGNYAFDDHVESYYSTTSYFNGTVKGSFLGGIGLQFALKQNYGLELSYMRQDTKASVDYYYDIDTHTDIDLSMNYIMIGGVKSVRQPGSKAEPFGGLMLGANFIHAENPNGNLSDDATKFAWAIRGGANIWASEKLAIKLQAMLISSVQGVGGSLYVGTGGAGAGVSTYSSVLQFVLGGGLAFKFGGR